MSPFINFTAPRSGRWTKEVHFRNPGSAALRIERASIIGDGAFSISPFEENWSIPGRSAALILQIEFHALLARELRTNACLEIVAFGYRFFIALQASLVESTFR